MARHAVFATTISVIAASLSLLGTVQPADANAVALFRGVRADATGRVQWTRTSFGVSGDPGTLSFFDRTTSFPAQCWLQISVDVAQVPVSANDVGTINITMPPAPAIPQWMRNPGILSLDDLTDGHWVITAATIGGASNNQSSDLAATAFNALFVAGNATVINGSLNTCRG